MRHSIFLMNPILEQMAVGMLENGELDCMSQVCIEYTITEV